MVTDPRKMTLLTWIRLCTPGQVLEHSSLLEHKKKT